MPQSLTLLTHEIDHIIATKHRGATTLENLSLACYYCNSFKGPNIASIDPETGQLCRLFNPRQDVWSGHFRWDHAELIGLTPIARATITVLEINLPERVKIRRVLLASGSWTAS